MGILNLFPIRVPIGSVIDGNGTTRDVLMTPEFARALTDVLQRIGGPSGLGSDDIALLCSFGSTPIDLAAQASEAAQSAPADLTAQVSAMRAEISDLRNQLDTAQGYGALAQQIEEMRKLIGMIEDPGAAVRHLLTTMAPLKSPSFIGVPTAPTAVADTNTTQLATTAYVIGQASSSIPLVDGIAAPGISLRYTRGDHRHPTDTSRQPTIVAGTASGSRGANAALASLLTALAGSGLVIDNTTV